MKTSCVAPTNLNALLFVCIVMSGCAHVPEAHAAPSFHSCREDKVRLEARSRELQVIVKADQDDRQDWQNKTSDEMLEVVKRDEIRRKRVGEIFGEGCFSTAEDYAAAALVYQHGDTPDHFYQTFIWSKRGVELGDEKQKRMMALGIDRYLVNIGQKELFGSQASKPDYKPETCWCIQKVERSFPDKLRKEIAGKNLTEAFDWLKELNANNKSCPNTECTAELKPSLKGTVPGFW